MMGSQTGQLKTMKCQSLLQMEGLNEHRKLPGLCLVWPVQTAGLFSSLTRATQKPNISQLPSKLGGCLKGSLSHYYFSH
jgi:hypothetical protein